jgi:hypothetical protein
MNQLEAIPVPFEHNGTKSRSMRRRSRHRAAFLATVFVATSLRVAGQELVPDILYDTSLSQLPVWVSSQLLAEEPSAISPEYWDDLLGWNAGFLGVAESDDCALQPLAPHEVEIIGNRGPKRTVHTELRQSFANAAWVGLFEVVGAESGFQGLTPGTLLRLSPREIVKGSAPLSDRYLFYPAGKVALKGREFCVAAEELPQLPTVGGRLILLSLERQEHRELLWDWDSLAVIVFPSGELADFPTWFAGARAGSAEEVVARLRGGGQG